MSIPRFQFQSAKQMSNGGGLPEAVQKTLTQFQSVSVANLQRSEGSVVTTVTQPEDGVYFAVVIAGPFAELDSLRAAIVAAVDQEMVAALNRIGLE